MLGFIFATSILLLEFTQEAVAQIQSLQSPESKCSTELEYEKFHSTEQLLGMMKACNVRTLEDFLLHLPKDLKRRYNLIYRTKGIGRASAAYPRILLSGYQSDIVLSTDSEQSSPLYGTVEIADYRPEKKDLIFKTITFHQSGKHKPRISANNPARCMECHHNDEYQKNQFIWNDLPFWPGVYGSMVDQHFYLNRKKEPGWDLNYYFSEDTAYKKLILPKLGQEGLFKYLAKDIYDPLDHYSFRTGLRPYAQFHEIQDEINTDALIGHLERKKLNINTLKYYLLYATICFPEQDDTLDQILAAVDQFVDPGVFKKMVRKVQKKHQFKLNSELLSISYEKAVLSELWNFLSIKFVGHFNALKSENCTLLNQLHLTLGEEASVDCQKQFLGAFGNHPEGNFWDQYGKEQALHITGVYMLLYLGMNAVDFPFEKWSMDRLQYSGYGTNRNSNMDLHNALFTVIDYSNSDPAMDQFFKKYYQVYDLYRPNSERPYFTAAMSTFKQFRDQCCSQVIAPKSKNFTRF